MWGVAVPFCYLFVSEQASLKHQFHEYLRIELTRAPGTVALYMSILERLEREFNTWYVRGLCLRLVDEGVDLCQAYRAAESKWELAQCSEHEGQVFPVSEVLGGHRARYWPEEPWRCTTRGKPEQPDLD